MKTTLNWTAGIAFASLLMPWTLTNVLAQSESDAPKFRPRTDANAKQDLELLREVLNRATDADGAINPLGKFQMRNPTPFQADSTSRIELGAKDSGSEKDGVDQLVDKADLDAEKKPTIESRTPKKESAQTKKNDSTSISQLPAPIYSITEQPTWVPTRIVDHYSHPTIQYPVSLASTIIPWRGDSGNYVANLQDVNFNAPGSASTGGVFPNPGFPQGSAGSAGGSFVAPTAPFNPNLAPGFNPNGTIVNTPLYNSAPLSSAPQPYYPPQSGINPGVSGNPIRSSSDAMPSYPRQIPMVNSAPFVSPAPCQSDARHMVSCEVYRQPTDSCGPTRYGPNGYASQQGGSPYSYVPSTYMPYSNNGYDSGYRPLIGFGQSLASAHLGRGIIGQPTAYVDGQPVRNFLRYIFP